MFYIQCYITSPAVLIITLVVRLTTSVQSLQQYLFLSVIFVIFYEMFVMKYELEVGWGKALWNAILPLILATLLITLIVLIAILM